MTDDNKDGTSLLDTLIDSAEFPPSQISRNILKALNQLASAAIDIPAACLEGKAREKRAETDARVYLIKTSAEQIARQMQIEPEYVRSAANKFGQRVIREQVNLDAICEKAKGRLSNDDISEDKPNPEKSIDDDWLNVFEEEARQKSSEEMQDYFGRLLAGEIKKPGTFSIRALRILGSLDQKTSQLFRKFCSAAVGFPGTIDAIDIRVCSLKGTAGENSLSKYGLSFSELNILNEYGLIISDYNSWREYNLCIMGTVLSSLKQPISPIPFKYQNKLWILLPTKKRNPSADFRLHGVALTSAGIELSHIVDIEPMDEYTKDLIDFFKTKNLIMRETKT